jgi:hypothetical protein
MLNELYGLSEALSAMAIPVKDWHCDYWELPKVTAKAPCIRIWIENDGSICGLDSLNAELARAIRKYGNNQNSFPAFNIVPLYRIADQQTIDELEQMEKGLIPLDIGKVKSWCTEDNWVKKITQVNRCIGKSALELQAYIEKVDASHENSTTALINSLNIYSNKKTAFRDELEAYVFSQLLQGGNVGLAFTVLFHKGNPKAKNKSEDSGILSVVLDCAEWRKYDYPVASEFTTDWVNDILLQSEIKDEGIITGERVDAFGAPYGNIGKPMPKVKLSGFDVTLRSMFHAQCCQERYGTFDGDSFPASRRSRYDLKGALEYISAADKENITWKIIDSNEIVFAYPSILADTPLKFVSLLGPPRDNDGSYSKARFEKCAEDFMRTFEGISPQNEPDNIRIFLIRKMDDARRKIVFTRSLSPKRYIECAERWQVACGNVPNINFIEPVTPFPLDISDIINSVWKRNGELATKGKTVVKRMQYYQGIELLIDDEASSAPVIKYYLNILLNNWQGLFEFYGNQSQRREKTKDAKKYFSNAEKSIARCWTLLGLLLYKSGYKKEDYMENVAYLLGQLLKVSDELHVMYCRVVRKNGEVPPQLAGNAMYDYALEAPCGALAVLGQRMTPYITWAKYYSYKGIAYDANDEKLKENKGKSSGLAGSYMKLYDNVSTKLKAILKEDTRFGDFEKAQMFLGYLAAFPKREKSNDDEIIATSKDE